MKWTPQLRPTQWLLVALSFVCVAGLAQAREPQKAMSQYVRERWGAKSGFPSGPVYGITQTADGYLWIGTEKGLVRFDGVNFRIFDESNAEGVPAGPILGLTADVEGNLWIRLPNGHLLRYGDGKFDDVTLALERPEVGVIAMCRGKDGEALFWGLISGPFEYRRGKFSTMAQMPAGLNLLVISMAETRDGTIWLGTRDSGLFQLKGANVWSGPKVFLDPKINALLAEDNQELWMGTDNGLARWTGTEFVKTGLVSSLKHVQVFAMAQDPQSNIWVGTSNGLFRIDKLGAARIEQRNGTTPSDAVTAVFEDREGNIWTGSKQGLERLSDGAFTTYSELEGLPSDSNGPVYVDGQGRTWFAPLEGGLYWLKDGRVGRVTNDGLDRDVVYSIDGDKDGLWFGRQRGGLTHLRDEGDSFSTETYSRAEGLAQNSIYAVHENRDGTVWAATLNEGVSRFRNGAFETYTTAKGLRSNSVSAIAESADGTMWFGTPSGLNKLSKEQWFPYTVKDGLPSDDVNSLFEDSTGVLWVGTAKGLAYIRAGRVSVPGEMSQALHEPILGIEEDQSGGLWIATANHVVRCNRDKLLKGRVGSGDVREYGLSDGLRGTEGVKRNRSVVKDQLGRIWVSMNAGLSVVDPARVTSSSPPTIVHIESVSGDGGPLDLQGPIRIPAANQRVTFSFVGLSLSAPERIRFKYKLDGFDQGWSDPVSVREATYTNLDARSYRFHVKASNRDGLWNGAESTVDFEIEPVFWRTWWFRLSLASVIGLVILMFFRLRMLRMQFLERHQLEITALNERLMKAQEEERSRIAGELHDGILQQITSLSLLLGSARRQVPGESQAKEKIGDVQKKLIEVGKDIRELSHELHPAVLQESGLPAALSSYCEEFSKARSIPVACEAEESVKNLSPGAALCIYRIAQEALGNVAKHSGAKHVHVRLSHTDGRVRLSVSDNGIGFTPDRAGEFGGLGLINMRERVRQLQGTLDFESGPGQGTTVRAEVPFHPADGR